MHAYTVEPIDPLIRTPQGVHALVTQWMVEQIDGDAGGAGRSRRQALQRAGVGRVGELSVGELVVATILPNYRSGRAHREPRTSSSSGGTLLEAIDFGWQDGGRSDVKPTNIEGNDGTVLTGVDGFSTTGVTGSNVFIYNKNGRATDVAVGLTLTTGIIGSGLRIYPRIVSLNAGSGPSGYCFAIQAGTFMFRETNGAVIDGASMGSVTWAAGDTVRVEAKGETFKVFRNGHQLGSNWVDSSNVYPGGKVGVRVLDFAARFTDFYVRPIDLP